METPHYLCVFRADSSVPDDVRDLGDDPDFRKPAPTWGICRPGIRHGVVPGSYIVFLGLAGGSYLLKGWFRVGEKLGYLEAMERFAGRPNVIVTDRKPVELIAAHAQWKRQDLREVAMQKWGTDRPEFLTSIRLSDRTLYQAPADPHELDNWKCQRIFRCRRSQLQDCLSLGICVREAGFAAMRDYVVAAPDDWADYGRQRLDWRTAAPTALRDRPLRTPWGQHNALRIALSDIRELQQTLGWQPTTTE